MGKRSVARDPNKTGLGDRACPEPVSGLPAEPLPDIGMVNMISPRQGDQDVRIEQVRFHISSSAARVCSNVMGGLPSGTSNCGNMLSVRPDVRGCNPFRTSSATASPREMPFTPANDRMTSTTSSGKFRVVRIVMMIASHHQTNFGRSRLSSIFDPKYGISVAFLIPGTVRL